MPSVTDYVVVQDSSTTLDADGDLDRTFSFEVPSNILVDRRAVLTWQMEVEDPELLKWNITINQTEVVSFIHGINRLGAFQEVISENILNSGSNDLTAAIVKEPGDSPVGRIKISDIVVLFQVDV